MADRQWLSVEQKNEVRKIITNLFAEGRTDRAIADTIRERNFPGIWSPVRICQTRKIMGLRKGEAIPPELRGQTPHDKLPPPHKDPDGIDDPADDAPIPRVQEVEYTFQQLIDNLKETVRFAEKVQQEFRKKGSAIFFNQRRA